MNEFIPHSDSESLYLPIVITGLSGGGKSTVAAKVEQSGIVPAVTYDGRLTTRGLRNDGEQEGKDGRFSVPRAEFENNPDLFFQYSKYNEIYAFSRSALQRCLTQGNTFIIGGEPDTAIPLRDMLNADLEAADNMPPRLKAISIYIRRPINEIILGIIAREAADAERLRRIKHIVEKESFEGRNVSYVADYTVENGEKRLEGAVTEVVGIIQAEREKQLKELLGSSFASSPRKFA